MEENEFIIYHYTRNGVHLSTPSIDVAFKRRDEGDVTQTTYGSE